MRSKILATLFILTFVFTSCNNDDDNDQEFELVNVVTPVYMTKDELRESTVNIVVPQETVESGKIYVYGDLILINDVDKGIHVIDNSNPLAPEKKVFIEIVGNEDMAVKGDFLYADSLMDVVVFDISDLDNITEVSRVEDVFQNYYYPVQYPQLENTVYNYDDYEYNPEQILVSFEVTEELREVVEEDDDIYYDVVESVSSDAVSSGEGGSLARFKIVDEYLYIVDNNYINIINISDLEAPEVLPDVYAGFGIETIFNRGEYLFLGSTNGMFIYDISSPDVPTYVSGFTHATACDPVVIDGDYAYVTLRGGNFCGAFESRLDVIDISVIENPTLVKTYPLDSPYGLGIKNDLLFICDGTSGLKVYNKENEEDIQLLQTIDDVEAYDVIPQENRLLMIGGNVLYQYEYLENELQLISNYALNLYLSF